jgi:hypothetical protein
MHAALGGRASGAEGHRRDPGPDGEVGPRARQPRLPAHRALAGVAHSRTRPPEPLGLQERAGAKASTGTRAIARMVQPASLDVVTPASGSDDGSLRHPRPLPGPPRHRAQLRAPRRGRPGAPARRAGRTTPPRPTTTRSRWRRCTRCSTRSPSASRDGPSRGPGQRLGPRLAAPVVRRQARRVARGRVVAAPSRWPSARLNKAGIGPLNADLSGAELRRAQPARDG